METKNKNNDSCFETFDQLWQAMRRLLGDGIDIQYQSDEPGSQLIIYTDLTISDEKTGQLSEYAEPHE